MKDLTPKILVLAMFFWVSVFSQPSIAQNDTQKTPEFFYEQAVKFHSNGQYKRAIEYYTKTIEADPDHVDAYYNRGLLHSRAWSFESAVADYRKVNALLPDFADAYGRSAWNLILLERFREAGEAAQKAYQLQPSNLTWIAYVGHSHLLTGDDKTAREYYTKAVMMLFNDHDLDGLVADLEMFVGMGWRTKACQKELNWVRGTITQMKNLARAKNEYLTGNRFFDAGDYHQALKHYDAAIALNPDNHAILSMKAFALERQGQSTPAIIWYKKAVAAAIIAHSYADVEDYNEQISYLAAIWPEWAHDKIKTAEHLPEDKAIQISKEEWLGLNGQGMRHFNMGDYQKAAVYWEKALETARNAFGPNHFKTLISLNNIAVIHNAQEEFDKALELSSDVVEKSRKALGADHPTTLMYMNNLAQIHKHLNQHAEAEALLKDILKISSRTLGEKHLNTITYYQNLAELYKDQYQFTIAGKLYEKVLSLDTLVLGENHPETIKSMNNLASVYQENGQYSAASKLLANTLRISRSIWGESHIHTLTAMNNLAVNMDKQGNYKNAEDLFAGAYQARKMVLGDQHPDTLSSLDGLAANLDNQGRYAEAEHLYLKAIQYRKSKLGNNHPDTLLTMSNFAVNLDRQGQYAKAAALCLKTLELRSDKLGANHPDTLTSMNNLASLYEAQGLYKKAEPYYLKVLEQRKQLLGAHHPDTLIAMSNAGGLWSTLGMFEKAKPLLSQVLLQRQKSLGEDHPDTIRSMSSLALLYGRLANYDQAETLFKDALQKTKDLKGEAHPKTFTATNNLAVLYEKKGLYDEAEILYIKALEKSQSVLGHAHPETLNLMANLADLYRLQGRYTDAGPMYEEALNLYQTAVGAKHPGTLTAMNNLATFYNAKGLYAKSEPMFGQVIESTRIVFGETHPVSLTAQNNLAALYLSQGRFEKAQELFAQTLQSQQSVLGKEHPDTFLTGYNLAAAYRITGQYEKAKSLIKAILPLSTAALGTDHPDTLTYTQGLADIYREEGALARAETIYKDVLQARRKALGDSHPAVLGTMNNLAVLLLRKGRHAEAEELMLKVLNAYESLVGENHPKTLTALNNLALFYQTQDIKIKAQHHWKNSLRRSNKFLEQVLWGASDKTRQSYLKQQNAFRNNLLSFLIANNTPETAREAMVFSLSRKGLLLRIASSVRSVLHSVENPQLKSDAQTLTARRQQFANLTISRRKGLSHGHYRKKLDALGTDIERLERRLGSQVERLNRLNIQVSPDAVVEKLNSDQVLIDFLTFTRLDVTSLKIKKDWLAALVVDSTSSPEIQLVDIGPLPPIQKLISAFRKAITDPESLEEDVYDLGRQLHDLIWKPLLTYTKKKKGVILVPDGVLHLLPFGALINKEGDYLIQTLDFTVLSSSRDIVLSKTKGIKKNPAIFFAPDYDAHGKQDINGTAKRASRTRGLSLKDLYFGPLPGTIQEGELILAMFQKKGFSPEKFAFDQAAENRLAKIDSPGVLHLATHGFFLANPSPPPETIEFNLISPEDEKTYGQAGPPGSKSLQDPLLRAGLALASANNGVIGKYLPDGTDGILTALEVLGLNLSGTQLVVLSACETGLGEIERGQGVYGLRRAFEEAGAHTVLSTLWQISDQGTQTFMTRFYDLFVEGIPARQALRRVQLEFITDDTLRHPFFWAPFVLVGK